MRRSDLLSLTGVSVGLFNNLSQRRLMPFPQPSKEGWGRFDANHALRLALFLELGRAGRSQEQAGALVRANYDELITYASHSEVGEILFGSFAIFEAGDGVSSQAYLPIICLFGGGGLDRAIERSLIALKRDHRHVCEIVVINASLVVGRLLDRARSEGLFDDSFDELAQCFHRSPSIAVPLLDGGSG